MKVDSEYFDRKCS